MEILSELGSELRYDRWTAQDHVGISLLTSGVIAKDTMCIVLFTTDKTRSHTVRYTSGAGFLFNHKRCMRSNV